MIKLETAHIEEVRGIRKLDIDFRKGTFAISGPNGSGKSGVIDAIEFGLTGQISRLTGRGTKSLSLSEHGPHVHYNEWANIGKKDFQPVVAAFKALLACFRCESCESWVHVTPRGNPETLRCGCNSVNLNLKPKPK